MYGFHVTGNTDMHLVTILFIFLSVDQNHSVSVTISHAELIRLLIVEYCPNPQGCVKLLYFGGNFNTLLYTSIQSIPNTLNG
jgi:hypothetical protein